MASVLTSVGALAQTMTLQLGSTNQGLITNRAGVNLAGLNYFGLEQFRDNLLGSDNPYFEPMQSRTLWTASVASSDASSFTTDTFYSAIPADWWAGAVTGSPPATFTWKSSAYPANVGCTGTIVHNTTGGVVSGANTGSLVSQSVPCANPPAQGDVVSITFGGFPTSQYEWNLNLKYTPTDGSCAFSSDTTTQYADGGRQSLVISVAAGHYCKLNLYFDTATINRYVSLDGTYTGTLATKVGTGSPTIAVNVQREGSGEACNNAVANSASWVLKSFSCVFHENANLPAPGKVAMTVFVTAGVSNASVTVDSATLKRTTPKSSSNPTSFRDEAIAALQAIFPQTGLPGSLRQWILFLQGHTFGSWTAAPPAAPVTSTFQAGSTTPLLGYGDNLSLYEFLKICQATNTEPYVTVPGTFLTSEWAQLADYLFNPTNSIRLAQGQTQPWTGPGGVFKKIRLEDSNEVWNSKTVGAAVLGGIHRYDRYAPMAGLDFAAFRSASAYVSGYVELGFSVQMAIGTENGSDLAYLLPLMPANGRPTFFDLAAYYMSYISDFDTVEHSYRGFINEAYMHAFDSADTYKWHQTITALQALNLCGDDHASPCKTYIYEQGKGITFACSSSGTPCGTTHSMFPTQAQIDVADSGFIAGYEAGLLALTQMKYLNIPVMNYFGLGQFGGNAQIGGGLTEQIYSMMSDIGGAQSAANGTSFVGKPQMLVYQTFNAGLAGPNVVPCPIDNLPSYDSPAQLTGNVNAVTAVPMLETLCTSDGATARGLVIFNNSLTTPMTIQLAGSTPMLGTVQVTQVAAAPGSLNTAAGTGSNATLAPTVLVNKSTMTGVGSGFSVTLPALSVTSFTGSTTTPPTQRWYFAAPASGGQ